LATARRRQKRTQRTIFIKTIEQRQDDGKPTAAQYVGAKNPVFAAKDEECNQNPKSRVTLRKAIHKETSCVFHRRGYVICYKSLRFYLSIT
jgi:hypothetical protein